MAEASGFRWTTLRVAALYPFALAHGLLVALSWQTLSLSWLKRGLPLISPIIGGLAAGACALALTRSFSLGWPTWAVAFASYALGSVVAGAIFGYIQLARAEVARLERGSRT